MTLDMSMHHTVLQHGNWLHTWLSYENLDKLFTNCRQHLLGTGFTAAGVGRHLNCALSLRRQAWQFSRENHASISTAHTCGHLHACAFACRTHEVVEISLKQMDALCGNALELQDGRGLPVMAMSTQVCGRVG
jgi:hypothetical protein